MDEQKYSKAAELINQSAHITILTGAGMSTASWISRDKIIRLHGTNLEAVCLSCKKVFPISAVLERIMSGEEYPLCELCRGLLKPNTISFGQQLIPSVIKQCEAATHACDLFLALGTSLQVYPAAGYVEPAGALLKPVIIINRDPALLDSIAEIVLQGELTDILPAFREGFDAN